MLCSRERFVENNLFLVKRLSKRTDLRNPDPTHKRFTSLAWAAALGHEETFEYLLSMGHDDREISRVSEHDLTLRVRFRLQFTERAGLRQQYNPHSLGRGKTARLQLWSRQP